LLQHCPAEQTILFDHDGEESARRVVALPERERAAARLVAGHMAFGLHEAFPGPTTYVTMLRDPVERIFSLVRSIRSRPDHPLHHLIADKGYGVREMLEHNATRDMDNGQVRLISGVWNEPAEGACTVETLERAKANLRGHFAWVGLAERFDESVMRLNRLFHWQPAPYVPANVSPRRPEDETSPPAETLEVIRRTNALDLELYRYAAGLFREQEERLGPIFRARLALWRLRRERAARLPAR
jgi:hypothetical protein